MGILEFLRGGEHAVDLSPSDALSRDSSLGERLVLCIPAAVSYGVDLETIVAVVALSLLIWESIHLSRKEYHHIWR